MKKPRKPAVAGEGVGEISLQEPHAASRKKKEVTAKSEAKQAPERRRRSAKVAAAGATENGADGTKLEPASGQSSKARGPNAYMLWKQQQWPALKEAHPELSFKELMRLTSDEWKAVDRTTKEKFEAAAKGERTREGCSQ